jgi:hypothetical protein
MINRFWSGLLAVLLLSGCGWNGTPTRSPEGLVPLTSIVIKGSQAIAAGTSTKFTADGYYLGVPVDITDKVAWSSASPAVADFKYTTAPNKNRVTAVTPGSAVVTATVDGVSATYTLTVSNATITAMTVTPATLSLSKGLTTQFATTGSFSDATTQDLTFDAVWSSTPGTFATVSNNTANKGLATATAIGNESVIATFGAVPVSGAATLTVTAATLQSITVTPANSSIAGLSKTVTFAAMGNYSDGTTVDITSTAVWASSQAGIATIVANSGVATTVAVGTTSISATRDGVSGKTNLTVSTLVLNANGLQISPTFPTLSIGTPQQFTVTATFSDGSTQNVAASSSWTSSNTTTATVNSTGSVTGNFAGSATITAAYGGQSVWTNVTVH